jgi:hypothetical protein
MLDLNRHTLEADLMRHQQSGDWATQAETLFTLAEIARAEAEYSLAQGLYAQAYSAYEHISDKHGMASALRGVADLMTGQDIWANVLELWQIVRESSLELDRPHLWMMYEQALALFIEVKDSHRQAEIYLTMGYAADVFNERAVGQCAFILSIACYEPAGQVDLIVDVRFLSERYRLRQPQSRAMIDRYLGIYRAAGDHHREGVVALSMADTAFWAKDYSTAHQYYAYAKVIFDALGNRERVRHILSRMARIAHRTHDYGLYRQYHAQARAFFAAAPHWSDLLTLWLELATIACDNRDFATARYAYQCAAVVATALREPQRQCRIYWQWGQMEYKAGYQGMGEVLCQWSIALVQTYDSDQVGNYQRELKHIRMRERQ